MLDRSEERVDRNDAAVEPGALHRGRHRDRRLPLPHPDIDDDLLRRKTRELRQGRMVAVPALDPALRRPGRPEAFPDIAAIKLPHHRALQFGHPSPRCRSARSVSRTATYDKD